MIHGSWVGIGRGKKSCLDATGRLILGSREGVIAIGRKKSQKLELTDLEELRNRVKEIRKQKKGIYKRFTKQSNKRR